MPLKIRAPLAKHRSLTISEIGYNAGAICDSPTAPNSPGRRVLANLPKPSLCQALQGELFPRPIRRGLIEAFAPEEALVG